MIIAYVNSCPYAQAVSLTAQSTFTAGDVYMHTAAYM